MLPIRLVSWALCAYEVFLKMAIAFVNSSGANADASSDHIDAAAFVATTGNTIVVLKSTFIAGGSSVVSVTDTALNTYTLCGTIGVGDADTIIECWAATNITGHAANVVTATFNVASTFRYIVTLQYSGLATSSVFDAESAITLDAFNMVNHVTADITTTQDHEVVIGFFLTFDEPFAFSEVAPYTIRRTQSDSVAVDQIVSSVGTYNPAVDTVAANRVFSFAKSFKAEIRDPWIGSAMPFVFGHLMKVPQNGSR